MRRLNDAGVLVFVVTNQSGVARGLYAEADVETLHAWMQGELGVHDAHIDDFRYCPFHPEGRVEAYRAAHPWRKPAPGMLLDLMAAWPVDAAHSLLIGDKDIDVKAGRAAGIAAMKVAPGRLLEAVERFLAEIRGERG